LKDVLKRNDSDRVKEASRQSLFLEAQKNPEFWIQAIVIGIVDNDQLFCLVAKEEKVVSFVMIVTFKI